jgi:radical SAM protein with 4Fe4S-binding SPASM domain
MEKKSSKCMSVDRAKQLLNEARILGVEVVDLTGGEPSMHPHFSTIVEHALSLGFEHLNICTNGYALDVNAIRSFDSTTIHCFISVDGVSEKVVQRIRGGKINKLMELFRELKLLKLKFTLRFCLNAQNWMETAEMLAFASDLGADAAFEATQIVGNAKEDLVLSREQMTKVSSIINSFPKANITVEESFTDPFPCDGGQSDLLSVNTDGIGTVCLMMGVNKQVILENASLKEMWDKLQVHKTRMKNFRPSGTRCDKCPHLPLCLSGCHVTAYTQQCFNPCKEES